MQKIKYTSVAEPARIYVNRENISVHFIPYGPSHQFWRKMWFREYKVCQSGVSLYESVHIFTVYSLSAFPASDEIKKNITSNWSCLLSIKEHTTPVTTSILYNVKNIYFIGLYKVINMYECRYRL